MSIELALCTFSAIIGCSALGWCIIEWWKENR